MNKALVAGGAGFLGSHLCERLLNEGKSVVCLDNFSSGRETNVAKIDDDKFEIVKGDICDPIDVDEEFDEIYHLASRASPADFGSYPIDIAMSNSLGTRNLLEKALSSDARVLLASTSEVYGDPQVHPQTETYRGNVNIRGIRAVYDESKRLSEALAVAYERQYGLDIRTVRIFNTYGPRMRPDDGRVIPNFVTQALSGQDLTIHGDGSQTRSFCYVSDLIDGFQKYMTETGLDGEVINLGGSQEITIQELAETIVDVVDTESELTFVERPEDDPERRQPDLTRARDRLEWEQKVDLRTGLERTITHFKEESYL